MQNRRKILALATASVISACASPPENAGPVTRYANGLWWNGRAFDRGDRWVAAGMFVRDSRQAAETIDLDGQYVVPPFGDAHQHVTTPASNDEQLQRGVFYLKNPNLLASAIPGLRPYWQRPETIDVVTSGPGITAAGGHPVPLYVNFLRPRVYQDRTAESMYGDAFHVIAGPADIEPALDALVRQGADFVKTYLLYSEEYERRKNDASFDGRKGIDPAWAPALVQAAHRRGLSVSAHLETAADLRAAIAAGVDEAAHMPGYSATDYGNSDDPIERYMINAADAEAARRSGMRIVTTAGLGGRTESPRRELRRRAHLHNLQHFKNAGATIVIGTDGGASITVAEAAYLIELEVFSATEALNCLAVTTPRAIFPNRRIGALTAGYEASFVTMREDPLARFAALDALELRVKQGFSVSAPA